MSELTANVAIGAAVLLAGISLVLAIVGFVAYRRIRHRRLFFVALGFLLFAVKGGYMVRVVYAQRGAIAAGTETFLPVFVLADLAVVVVMYFAAWTR